jgi:orotate phosphoribosyltransferase
MVDDVMTSGSSVREIEEKYIKPRFDDYNLSIFVIVDRQQHSMENVHGLITLQDIKHMRFKKK